MAPPRREKGSDFPPTLKRLGQHFLSDPRILERIADALALRGAETVVEIGAGRGSLTEFLVPRARRVVALELDRALASLLRERYASEPKVRIIEGDALKIPLAESAAPDTEFVVVGNVPYYITTPLIFHALARPRPTRAVFLVQREVAERLTASPTAGDYGALTVNVKALADVEILFRVAPGAFNPPPKVESAVVRVTPRERPLIGREEEEALRALVQGAFGARRKQMRNVVRTVRGVSGEEAGRALDAAGIAPDARPETVGVERFVALLRALAESEVPRAE